MKALLKPLIFCLLASTPWSIGAEESQNKSFAVELEKWQIARGDTLSEIAQKLLPDNKSHREQLMYKILELNPVAFPTNNIDFMLAFNTLFFPTSIDGISIKQALKDSIDVEKEKPVEAEDTKPSNLTPLYVAPSEINTLNKEANNSVKNDRFYAISDTNVEIELEKSTVLATHNYQYVTTGKKSARVNIDNGPSYLLAPNTRLKVYTQTNNAKNQCQINLIYGLLRILEQKEQQKHCGILTQVAKISTKNSAFVVRVCNQGDCIIESENNGKSSLPAGLYYGVVKGKISVTDEIKEYKVTIGEINYYSSINNKPLTIKHFKGLLFNDKDLQAIKKGNNNKKKFAWGSIQSHSQDDDYIEDYLDIRTDYSDTQFTKKIEAQTLNTQQVSKPKDKKTNEASNLDRFN